MFIVVGRRAGCSRSLEFVRNSPSSRFLLYWFGSKQIEALCVEPPSRSLKDIWLARTTEYSPGVGVLLLMMDVESLSTPGNLEKTLF